MAPSGTQVARSSELDIHILLSNSSEALVEATSQPIGPILADGQKRIDEILK